MSDAMSAGRRETDRGGAAVEFALVLPFLLLIIFGLIDFGRMLNTKIALTEAAREGARAATIQNTSAAATNRVQTVVGTIPVTVTVTDQGGVAANPCLNAEPSSDAIVTVTNKFQLITPFAAIAGMFPGGNSGTGTVIISSTGVMPCRA
jgi:Flp pilus assembly protein TadG